MPLREGEVPDFDAGKIAGKNIAPVTKSKKQAKAILLSYLKKEGRIKAPSLKSDMPKRGPRKII